MLLNISILINKKLSYEHYITAFESAHVHTRKGVGFLEVPINRINLRASAASADKRSYLRGCLLYVMEKNLKTS